MGVPPPELPVDEPPLEDALPPEELLPPEEVPLLDDPPAPPLEEVLPPEAPLLPPEDVLPPDEALDDVLLPDDVPPELLPEPDAPLDEVPPDDVPPPVEVPLPDDVPPLPVDDPLLLADEFDPPPSSPSYAETSPPVAQPTGNNVEVAIAIAAPTPITRLRWNRRLSSSPACPPVVMMSSQDLCVKRGCYRAGTVRGSDRGSPWPGKTHFPRCV
jgi:hypothetical protein